MGKAMPRYFFHTVDGGRDFDQEGTGHADAAKQGKNGGPKGPYKPSPDDWECASCKAMNAPHRTSCYHWNCGKPKANVASTKPAEGGEAPTEDPHADAAKQKGRRPYRPPKKANNATDDDNQQDQQGNGPAPSPQG